MDLSVKRSLELLENLEQTVSSFAQKEEHLLRDLRSRRFTASRKHQDVIEATEARLISQTAEADELLSAHQQRLTQVYENRRAALNRAHLVATRNLPKRVRATREAFLGELQMRRYRLERKLSGEIEALGGNHEEFNAKLAELKVRFTKQLRTGKRLFGGYQTLNKLFKQAVAPPQIEVPEISSATRLLKHLETHIDLADDQLREFKQYLGPRVFGILPLPGMLFIFLLLAGGFAFALGLTTAAYVNAVVLFLLLSVAVLLFHQSSLRQAKPAGIELAGTFAEANAAYTACNALKGMNYGEEQARLQAEFDDNVAALEEQRGQADGVAATFQQKARTKLETQHPRVLAKIDSTLAARLQHETDTHHSQTTALTQQAESQIAEMRAAEEADLYALSEDEKTHWEALAAEWKATLEPLYAEIGTMNAALRPRFPEWSEDYVAGWSLPTDFSAATRFAHLDVDLAKHAMPKDERLALPGPAQLSIPLSLSFPDQGSLLFESSDSGSAAVMEAFNNIILRLLATTPPGKLSFTIIDPVGLGQNFAGLMHLSDYEETLISRRIWTQREQIEERLAELSEHIEKVIQMYLRNEYATITEYNEQAGSVAEKYHFLVIADFPVNFSETAARRLQSIATSGARCGIFTIIHWDQRQPLPEGFVPDELRQNSICIRREKNAFILGKEQTRAGATLQFDTPPSADLAVDLVHKIGKSSIDSNLVQVPFTQIAPKPDEYWTNDTTHELRIPIGRTGATKLQYMAIGKGTRQHALFAGKTGSGKSTLFHVIITNLALSCSPEQVEFYLIDFKKGVEFKCYATKKLPHARVVAIESDREFALSVLQRVDGELKRRGDMFRKLGVQDIAGYKRAGGTEPMPRSLLLIDEFQEFFVDDDTIAQTASLLFDRIVRQGRAFGIHVLLGSQTLGGAYSLARATLGQMVIRVALQCNEADAYLIMDENNSAPRLLSRPGEGIYNDSAGAMEGNSPFQVVWLPDQERDEWLEKVRDVAEQRDPRAASPIVFEGNAPADVRENDLLRDVLELKPAAVATAARAWLGAPNSIKGPTEVVFRRQSGNHLLIVGQREEAAVTMLGMSILALAAQHPAGGARFIVFHSTSPGSSDEEFLEHVARSVPQEVTLSRGNDMTELMSSVTAEMKERTGTEGQASDSPSIFVIVHGLHKFKKLRQEDDFSFSMSDDAGSASTGSQFTDLISEGSALGIHVITTVDTFNNVNRAMNRKVLSEFEMRVIFQMSANDSASLIDSPKASNLGLHRALFYNEHEGTLETFRPYATPTTAWLDEAAAELKAGAGAGASAGAAV